MIGGDSATVVSRARQANIAVTVVSPLRALMPRGLWTEGGADAYAGNEECFDIVQKQNGSELMQWCVVNPWDPRTFTQAEAMLQTKECAGIKLHPEEHCYEIKERGAQPQSQQPVLSVSHIVAMQPG